MVARLSFQKEGGGSNPTYRLFLFYRGLIVAFRGKQMAGKVENLKPFTKENAKEMQLKGAEKRKENNAKRKLLSELYADFLEEEFEIKEGEKGTRKISGAEYCKLIAKKVLNRSDSSSVAMLREIRESTEGSKVSLSGEITTKMQTTEERLKAFNSLMGKNE